MSTTVPLTICMVCYAIGMLAYPLNSYKNIHTKTSSNVTVRPKKTHETPEVQWKEIDAQWVAEVPTTAWQQTSSNIFYKPHINPSSKPGDDEKRHIDTDKGQKHNEKQQIHTKELKENGNKLVDESTVKLQNLYERMYKASGDELYNLCKERFEDLLGVMHSLRSGDENQLLNDIRGLHSSSIYDKYQVQKGDGRDNETLMKKIFSNGIDNIKKLKIDVRQRSITEKSICLLDNDEWVSLHTPGDGNCLYYCLMFFLDMYTENDFVLTNDTTNHAVNMLRYYLQEMIMDAIAIIPVTSEALPQFETVDILNICKNPIHEKCGNEWGAFSSISPCMFLNMKATLFKEDDNQKSDASQQVKTKKIRVDDRNVNSKYISDMFKEFYIDIDKTRSVHILHVNNNHFEPMYLSTDQGT